MALGLSKPRSEIFVPDGMEPAKALSRTTHLGIGAHPDDLEILAIHGIVECFSSEERWFSGVVVTDGAGSPMPEGARPSPDAIAERRRTEQKRAAELGRYGALVLLDHTSAEAKDVSETAIVRDLAAVLAAASPEVVYTHNLADAHDTHVAVALAVIAACRSLAEAERPKRVIGCEVWRDLDWLEGSAKVAMPVDRHEALEAALIRAFESQLEAGKRLDTGAMGRRRANATFFEAKKADGHDGIVWGMDLGPAVRGEVEPQELVEGHLRAFASDLGQRLRRFAR